MSHLRKNLSCLEITTSAIPHAQIPTSFADNRPAPEVRKAQPVGQIPLLYRQGRLPPGVPGTEVAVVGAQYPCVLPDGQLISTTFRGYAQHFSDVPKPSFEFISIDHQAGASIALRR